MKYTHFIAGSILAAGMLFTTAASAEEVTSFTVEQYQAAIEQFGVSAEEARAAAIRAVEAQSGVTQDKGDAFAKLVANFRKGSSY